jgi:hypothetical protein
METSSDKARDQTEEFSAVPHQNEICGGCAKSITNANFPSAEDHGTRRTKILSGSV